MPNLRGPSTVGHDDGYRSYVAQTVSSGRPHRQRRDRGEVLRMATITIMKRKVLARGANAQAGAQEGNDPAWRGGRRAGGQRKLTGVSSKGSQDRLSVVN